MKHTIQLRTFAPLDLNEGYTLFKEGLYKVSQEAFGWDENFQRERFFKAYQPEWFHWIMHSEEKVGYVCFHASNEDIHFDLIIMNPAFQGKGYGKETMNLIADIARESKLAITLSVLKNNTGALKLYKSLNYEIIGEDQYFLEMKLTNP